MKRLICYLRGHDFRVERKVSMQSFKVCCTRCKRAYAYNDGVGLSIPWDREIEQFYQEFGELTKV